MKMREEKKRRKPFQYIASVWVSIWIYISNGKLIDAPKEVR